MAGYGQEDISEHVARGRWIVSPNEQFLGGMPLMAWCRLLVRARWQPTACYLPRMLYVTAQTISTSFWSFVEAVLYGRKVSSTPLPHAPIFILGHFRSGTTMLHHLMGLDPANATPSLLSCYHPHKFLLIEKSKEERERRHARREGAGSMPRNWLEAQQADAEAEVGERILDAVKESAYTPWEDEYGVCLLSGGLSNYCGQGSFGPAASRRFDRFLLPYVPANQETADKRGHIDDNEKCDDEKDGEEALGGNITRSSFPAGLVDEWTTEEEDRRWREAMELFCRKQVVCHGQEKRLVLKSPWHTCRVATLLEMFPDARFVFLHRNPLEVLKSSERIYMKLLPFRQMEEGTRRLGDVHRWLLRNYDRMHWAYLHYGRVLLQKLCGKGEKRLVEISFDDLTGDEVATLQGVYEGLGLEWTAGYEEILRSYVQAETAGVTPQTGTPLAARKQGKGEAGQEVSDVPAIDPAVWQNPLLDLARKESFTVREVASTFGYPELVSECDRWERNAH